MENPVTLLTAGAAADRAKNLGMAAEASRPTGEAWLEYVRRQVGSLRYGVVQIVVHDGRVTQIEKTERLRLERPPGNGDI
jgi:hypothetical protein